ncbi:PNPOx family protein [Ferroglobus placidus]
MSEFRSRKIKNIMRDNRVSLVVDVRDENDPFKNEGVLISGFAKIYLLGESEVENYDIIYHTYELFKSKYSDFVEFEDKGDVLVEIKIVRGSYWKGPRFKTFKID